RLRQPGQQALRGRLRERVQARAHPLCLAGLRRGAAHQRRGARREGQARRPGRDAPRPARRALRVRARRLQVQRQPRPDPELLRAHRGQRRQGRAHQQVVQRPDPQGSRRRLRARLPDGEVNGVLVLEQALNGLQYGLMLFLLAAGLTIVFGVMDMINLAHGSLYMVGAFLAAWLAAKTGSFWLGVAGAVALTAAFGMVLEATLLRTLYARDHLSQVLATFALILILDDGVK